MMKQHRHIRRKLVGALAAFVVFCTTYALILPAVTLSSPVHCGKEEHTHTEDCYQSDDWLCGLEEASAEGHVHDDSCYEEQEVLICQLEEGAEHVHDASCYEVQKVLTCQKEEGQSEGHVHTDECRRSGTPLCGKEEHTHSRQCESDPEAVETEEEWKKDFADLKEEDLNKRILKIAESQLGYKESEKNFRVNEDGSEDGYTRYGDWAGESYGDWNNAFTGFVLSYAKADAGWKKDSAEWLSFQADSIHKDLEKAEAGDVVFYRSSEGVLETGILKEAGEDKLEVIAGGQDREVKKIDVSKDLVAGVLASGDKAAESSKAEGGDETVETETENSLEQVASDEEGTVEVTARYSEVAGIPDDYTLKVAYLETLENGTRKYDIGFYSGEEEFEPDAPVQISLKFLDGSFTNSDALSITHYKKDGTVETVANTLKEDEEGKMASLFSLESFSVVGISESSSGTSKEITISYDINTGNMKPDSGSDIYPVPLIQNKLTFSDTVKTGTESYLILSPNVSECGVGVNRIDNGITTNNYTRQMYKFDGWIVNGQEWNQKPLTAGDSLTADQLENYANSNSTIKLTAKWTAMGNVGSVNFFVNMTLNIPDDYAVQGSNPIVDASAFLPSAVYSSSISVTDASSEINSMSKDAIFLGYYSKDCSIGNSTAKANTVNEVHSDIISLTNGEITLTSKPSAKSGYTPDLKGTFHLTSLPDDSKIFEEIRRQVDAGNPIKDSNGKAIISKEQNNVKTLTPENYSIKWYVFKSASNGWHIDGCLQRNPGRLTVTKTFYGNNDAIESVKNDYSIDVLDSSGSTAATLVLNEQASDNQIAPDSTVTMDDGSIKYKWVLTLDAGSRYVLKEKNYTADSNGFDEDGMATIPQYNVTGTSEEAQPLSPYETKGVAVTVKSYSPSTTDDAYQTVNFFNGYFPENHFLLRKTDDFGNPLSGAGFQLYKDDSRVKIYQTPSEPDVYYMFAKGDEELSEGYQRVENDTISVNAQGYASIVGLKTDSSTGLYEIREVSVPEGYAELDKFEIQVDQNSISLVKESDFASIDNNTILVIKNNSDVINVNVQKVWSDGTAHQDSVTVQLMRNGVATGTPIVLNEKNNWLGTWVKVPARVGGNEAEYTVRETYIGNLAYNEVADPSDGYRDYLVNVTQTRSDEAINFTVTNTLDQHRLMFAKISDDGSQLLPGAEFQLYTDVDCQKPHGSPATSGEDGIVDFGNQANAVYYMREVSAPDGYELSSQVYKVTVTDTGNTIVKIIDGEADGNSVNQIKNTRKKTSITLKKTDEKSVGISGAVFILTMPDGTEMEIDFGSSNTVTVGDLLDGLNYELKEIKAPAGYNLLTTTLNFDIQGGSPNNSNYASIPGFSVDPQNNTITIQNTTGRELPNTGGSGTQLLTSAGAAMVAGSLLMYGYKKRLRGKERRSK